MSRTSRRSCFQSPPGCLCRAQRCLRESRHISLPQRAHICTHRLTVLYPRITQGTNSATPQHCLLNLFYLSMRRPSLSLFRFPNSESPTLTAISSRFLNSIMNAAHDRPKMVLVTVDHHRVARSLVSLLFLRDSTTVLAPLLDIEHQPVRPRGQ